MTDTPPIASAAQERALEVVREMDPRCWPAVWALGHRVDEAMGFGYVYEQAVETLYADRFRAELNRRGELGCSLGIECSDLPHGLLEILADVDCLNRIQCTRFEASFWKINGSVALYDCHEPNQRPDRRTPEQCAAVDKWLGLEVAG